MPPNQPIRVLYVRDGGMDDLVGDTKSRMAQELADAGVVIEHLSPSAVEAARKEGVEAFQVMVDRLRAAELVLVGPRVKARDAELACATVLLRHDIAGGTWLDHDHREYVDGLGYFPGHLVDDCFQLMSVDRMMLALHEQHAGAALNTQVVVVDYRTGIRPPRAMPFRAPEWGYTEGEIYGSMGRTLLAQARGGLLDPALALFDGYGDVSLFDLLEYVAWMFDYLPSDRLPCLADERMRAVWEAIAEDATDPTWPVLASAVRAGLVRDGGVHTLAACPPSVREIQAQIEGEWAENAAKNLAALPNLRFSYGARMAWGHKPIPLLADSALVPQEDPFEGGVVGPNYLPTYHTLCVARRYRPAPEVVRIAHQLFGSRPFVRDDAGDQLMWFVQDSPPSSVDEMEDWCRLLHSLQGKRALLKRVAYGCARWDVIPPDIMPHVLAAWSWDPDQEGRTRHVYTQVPWLAADGNPKPGRESEIPTSMETSFHLRKASLRESGGPHALSARSPTPGR